jgi:hypothetical protein
MRSTTSAGRKRIRSSIGAEIGVEARAMHPPFLVQVIGYFWPGFTDLSGLPVASSDAFRWKFRCPLWQSPGGFYPQPSGPYGVDWGAVAASM